MTVCYSILRSRWRTDETRVTMKDVIALLETERAELLDRVARVDAAIAALVGGKPGRSRSSAQPAKPARRRRNMSDEERKAASERMKNYWAERRKQSAAGDAGKAGKVETEASEE